MGNNLMIVGFNVKCNDNGLYSLNDIHRASGGKAKNTPARWLERKGTQDLIDSALKRINRDRCVSQKWDAVLDVNNGGRDHGVYAHELLVVSYAGWIDSDFQIEVNHTFLETIKERAKALENENKKLTDFKDDFYRKQIANNMLAKDYSKFDRDVIKGIKIVVNSLKYNKEISYKDIFSMGPIYGKPAKTAVDYVMRNVVECVNPRAPLDKRRYVAKTQ